MSRSRLLAAVIAGWSIVGALLVVFAPRERALDPDSAFLNYGSARTSFSSAPAGTLAFYVMLERLGFECERLANFELPGDGALLVLEPQYWLDEEEIGALLRWVEAGGSLIYAPGQVDARLEDNGESVPIEVPDPLVGRLELDERLAEGVAGMRRGAGRITVLLEGAARLSNTELFEQGVDAELPWLRTALAGKRRVFFDEARAGAMLSGGALSALLAGGFGGP
ncbi:MAG: DUF4350 domain-containing protein, partial [Myxococcota bacterium]